MKKVISKIHFKNLYLIVTGTVYSHTNTAVVEGMMLVNEAWEQYEMDSIFDGEEETLGDISGVFSYSDQEAIEKEARGCYEEVQGQDSLTFNPCWN